MPRREDNRFEPHHEQIAQLAHQGLRCREILEQIGMTPSKGLREHLRRFLHSRELPIANRGAQTGEKHRDWKGGQTIDKDGYVLVQAPDHPASRRTGYVLEHRLVMEQHLGRFLDRDEVVHHKNGNKQDNRIENLELFQTNATHLAQTIRGQIPQWTDEGKLRIRAGVMKSVARRQVKANRDRSESGDPE